MAFRGLHIFKSMAERDGVAAALTATLAYIGAKVGLKNLVREYQLEAQFDKKYGLDTRDIVDVEDLGLGKSVEEHAFEYYPTQAHEFASAMKRLDIDHRVYQFIDYGSGKGKVLFLAAEFPFMSIEGIEASEALHRIACANIKKFPVGSLKCTNIKSTCLNAAEFVPANRPTVAYMYNPFDDVVMRAVLSNLEDALGAPDRPSYLIYRNPEHHDTVLQTGHFEHVADVVGGRITIYRLRPKEHA